MYLRSLAVWVVVGFSPTVMILYLVYRWWRRRDNDSWADVNDTSTLMEWLLPATAVLATLPLFALHKYPSIRISIACLIPMVVFRTLIYVARLMHLRPNADPEVYRTGYIIRGYAAHISPLIGIAAYMCFTALIQGKSFMLRPGARLYVSLVIASWAGGYMFNRVRDCRDYVSGQWRLLAPCELFKRIREIASLMGGRINTVYAISNQSYRWVGACAVAKDEIALTDALVKSLTKKELDAIIAHEAGHTIETYYWGLYYPIWTLAWLAWFVIVMVAGLGLTRLPHGFGFMHYILWCAAFVVPGFVHCWYRRSNERAADRQVSVLDNPKAAISAYEKLALANDLPPDRPWWSKITSTHPTLGETISAVARQAGLSADEVKLIREAARSEYEQNTGERYEMECHISSSPELLPRPNDASVLLTNYIVAVLGAFVLITSFVFYEPPLGPSGLIPVFSIMGGTVGVVVGIYLLANWIVCRPWRKFQGKLRENLTTMYPSVKEDMLLVDSAAIQDWPSSDWYGALLDVSADGVLLLSEGRELRIAIGSITSVSSHNDSSSARVGNTMLSFEQDGIPQWLMIRALKHPEKGMPRNSKEMERWLRQRLSDAGANLDAMSKDKTKLAAKRLPLALFILASTACLAWLSAEMMGFSYYSLLVSFCVALNSGVQLWNWLYIPETG